MPLAEKDGGKCIEATADNAYSGNYPLARFLYVYVNKAPGKPLDPLVREFVKLMLSQARARRPSSRTATSRFPAAIAKEELNKVQ